MLWVVQAQTAVLFRLRRARFAVVDDRITWRLPTRSYRGCSSTSRANHTMPVVRSDPNGRLLVVTTTGSMLVFSEGFSFFKLCRPPTSIINMALSFWGPFASDRLLLPPTSPGPLLPTPTWILVRRTQPKCASRPQVMTKKIFSRM
jgi:hypothetical protein